MFVCRMDEYENYLCLEDTDEKALRQVSVQVTKEIHCLTLGFSNSQKRPLDTSFTTSSMPNWVNVAALVTFSYVISSGQQARIAYITCVSDNPSCKSKVFNPSSYSSRWGYCTALVTPFSSQPRNLECTHSTHTTKLSFCRQQHGLCWRYPVYGRIKRRICLSAAWWQGWTSTLWNYNWSFQWHCQSYQCDTSKKWRQVHHSYM